MCDGTQACSSPPNRTLFQVYHHLCHHAFLLLQARNVLPRSKRAPVEGRPQRHRAQCSRRYPNRPSGVCTQFGMQVGQAGVCVCVCACVCMCVCMCVCLFVCARVCLCVVLHDLCKGQRTGEYSCRAPVRPLNLKQLSETDLNSIGFLWGGLYCLCSF